MDRNTHTAPASDTLSGQPISRRQLLRRGAQFAGGAPLLGAGPGLLAACSSSKKAATSATTAAGGAALTSVKLQLNHLENSQFAGSFYAENKGSYKDAGVDVPPLPGGPNLSPEPIVVAGTALVAISHTAEII